MMDLRQVSVKAPFGMSGRVTDPLPLPHHYSPFSPPHLLSIHLHHSQLPHQIRRRRRSNNPHLAPKLRLRFQPTSVLFQPHHRFTNGRRIHSGKHSMNFMPRISRQFSASSSRKSWMGVTRYMLVLCPKRWSTLQRVSLQLWGC
jgi:hypothetical protein